MNSSTKVLAQLHEQGFKAESVSITHLPELREDIDRHIRQGLIDSGINETYMRFRYDYQEILSGAAAIFIIAIPQPVTRACFAFRGKVYNADVPPTYIAREDDALVKKSLLSILEPSQHKIARAILPVKTLAVRTGLAQYGRNNITYVPGFGSYHRLVAFYADCPCDTDHWHDLAVMKACDKCTACRDRCPTRCIPVDRFLIHAENCLTWHNENAGEFAPWIRPEWHNALVGCMHCQVACPVNKPQQEKPVDGPDFKEAETTQILQPVPFDNLPEETRRKLESIAVGKDEGWLARNLKALIDKPLQR